MIGKEGPVQGSNPDFENGQWGEWYEVWVDVYTVEGAQYGGSYFSHMRFKPFGTETGRYRALNRLFSTGGNLLDNLNEWSEGTGPAWATTGSAILNIFGLVSTAYTHASRPMYTGIREWGELLKAGKALSNRLGGAGVIISVIDIGVKGSNTSNTLDLVAGAISFSGPGAVIGGLYFVGNLASMAYDGKTLGQRAEENFYIIPTAMIGAPLIVIPKN
jgi:hypothetical protein